MMEGCVTLPHMPPRAVNHEKDVVLLLALDPHHHSRRSLTFQLAQYGFLTARAAESHQGLFIALVICAWILPRAAAAALVARAFDFRKSRLSPVCVCVDLLDFFFFFFIILTR